MREKMIEQKLVKHIQSCGGLALKFVSPGVSGVPDRLILLPGSVAAFAEIKSRGCKPRPIQKVIIAKLEKLGFLVFVIDDPSQIPVVIEEVKNHAACSS